MNENKVIKSTLPSVTSSFSFQTFSKSKSKSLMNSQLSTKSKLTKQSNIASSQNLKLKDISAISSYNNNNYNNSSFASFLKKKDNNKFSSSTTKSSNTTRRRIAFNKCIPKKESNRFKASLTFIKPKLSNNFSKEIIEICKSGIPKESNRIYNQGIKKPNKLNIKLFSIISPKKKVKNIIPKEINLSESKSPEEYLKGVFNPLLKYQRKLFNHHINAIHREIAVQYSNIFTLVQKQKFTEKYRLSHDLIQINSHNKDINREKINEMKVQKDLSNIIISSQKTNKMIKNSELLQKYKTVMISAAIHFKKLDISIEYFYNKDYVAMKPFDGKEGDLFLNAIKAGDVNEIIKMLNKNKYLVFHFDYVSKHYHQHHHSL